MISTSDSDSQLSSVELHDLPAIVMQNICQLLIDSGHSFAQISLRDVMALRSTCVYFRDIINDMVLFLKFHLTDDWLKTSSKNDENSIRAENMLIFLNFMQTETKWRFVSFKNALHSWEKFDNISLLRQYETLFQNKVNKVTLSISEENFSSVQHIIQWLEEKVLKSNFKFKVTFRETVLTLSNPNVVSSAVFDTCLDRHSSYECERLVQKISFYTNLKKLVMSGIEFKIENLKLFPSLESLSVGHLDFSNYKIVSAFPRITSIGFQQRHNSNLKLLSCALNKCFPRLNNLDFFAGRGCKLDGYFSLPSCCYLLSISSYLLEKFIECQSLKCVSLSHFGEIAKSYDHFEHGNQLQISVLKLNFSVRVAVDFLGLLKVMSNIVKSWNSLEVLNVWLITYLMGCNASPAVYSFRRDVCEWMYGGEKFECDEFVNQLDELRKLWIASNIQILSCGQIVWMKKSTNLSLMKYVPSDAKVSILEES